MNNHNVGYILVGGFAVILYGYRRVTGDIDIWVKRTNYTKPANTRLMTDEIKKYLLEQCREWMLPEEIITLRRISLTEHGEEATRKTALQELKIEKMYGFTDEKTNALAELGKEKMLLNIAERLLKENGNEIINNCPKCGRLARIPKQNNAGIAGIAGVLILYNKLAISIISNSSWLDNCPVLGTSAFPKNWRGVLFCERCKVVRKKPIGLLIPASPCYIRCCRQLVVVA